MTIETVVVSTITFVIGYVVAWIAYEKKIKSIRNDLDDILSEIRKGMIQNAQNRKDFIKIINDIEKKFLHEKSET